MFISLILSSPAFRAPTKKPPEVEVEPLVCGGFLQIDGAA
jgi:hypothetical protein